ncbi:hypothetical protein R9C00_27780 [Flammeovirgaceae bacterium SG7u.111]|nr:hypothetical protein [Flammeovirgaceae bacterium SG7u.132]WPO35502.1 hypothetical protein R9C00_27780 [Flammeovirgaceae bacterium SG7u.111]
MKKVLNISAIFASMLLMAISCDPEDIGFNVSKTMEESYLVEVTESKSGVIEETKNGIINLQDSEEFQEYKDNMNVESINKMFVTIEPAEGETSVIGTADITKAGIGLKNNGNIVVNNWIVHKDLGKGAEYSTLDKIASAGKISVLDIFPQSEIDGMIDTFNNGEELFYLIIIEMEGEAPIKFNVTFEYDITAKVNPAS